MAIPNFGDLARPAVAGAQPTSVTQPGSSAVVRARPGKPFFLVFYPKQSGNWAALEIKAGEGVPPEDVGHWWLCVPQRVEVRPGVGGHRTLKAGQDPNDAHRRAHNAMDRRGGIVLPKEYGYEIPLPCIDPVTRREGHIYTDVWSRPLAQLDDERIAFDFDHQRFRRWLLALHRTGIIPEMDERIAVKHARRLDGHVARRAALLELPEPQRKDHVNAAKAEAEATKIAVTPNKPQRRKPAAIEASP